MGKGRHGGGGFHGGGGGFHGGGFHGGFHGGHGGFGGMHHAGGFHHGGMGMGMHHAGFHGGFNHGAFHGMGGARMFHGSPGYRGWWHPGGFGYWHGGWAGYGWFGRPCFNWFYPGWFYGWYGTNLLFTGYPFFFGLPYYRPWYIPPQPSTTVVIVQQPATSAAASTAAPQYATAAGKTVAVPSAPPSYDAATTVPVATPLPAGTAPFGGDGESEPALPPTYATSVKATIEAAFEYASQHASVFWKFGESYPSGYEEIDAYFQRFAAQKEIDCAVFSEQSLQDTIGFWDKLLCNAAVATVQKRQLRTQRIKSAYREFLLAHCARDSSFNAHFSNFQVAAHALYGCISKRYAMGHPNDPVVFNFEELQQFVAMLESRFGTTELAIDADKSEKGKVPFFAVLMQAGR